jgi:hypothetical protein
MSPNAAVADEAPAAIARAIKALALRESQVQVGPYPVTRKAELELACERFKELARQAGYTVAEVENPQRGETLWFSILASRVGR